MGAGLGGEAGFAQDIRSCDTLICDDRGGETADFFGIIEGAKRVLIVHAKAAENASPGASARKLQDVTRQAQASLAFAGSSRQVLAFPNIWGQQWEVVLKDAGNARIRKPRLLGPHAGNPQQAHARLMLTLADPSYTKEVVMLTSGILSASAAKDAMEHGGQRELQFIYFLASVRSTFDRAGVRFRIIANE